MDCKVRKHKWNIKNYKNDKLNIEKRTIIIYSKSIKVLQKGIEK